LNSSSGVTNSWRGFFLGWLFTLVPFLAIRKLFGPAGFAAAWSAAILGVVIFFLAVPIAVWWLHLDDYDNDFGPYPQSMARFVAEAWWMVILCGAVFGLTCWWIERKVAGYLQRRATPVPPAAKSAAGWLRRHPLGLVFSSLVLLTIVSQPHWWPPHENWWSWDLQSWSWPSRNWPWQSSAPSRLPHFTLIRERWIAPERHEDVRTPVWSPAGSVVAINGGDTLVLWDYGSDLVRTVACAPAPFPLPPPAFVSGDQILVSGGSTPDAAFSVVDVHSGAVVHEEPGPQPGAGQNENRARWLAVSPDQTTAAIVVGSSSLREEIIFYRTTDWSKIRTTGGSPAGGANYLAFAADGARFVVDYGIAGSRVFETESGRILTAASLRVYHHPAINRDGSMLAHGDGGGAHVTSVATGRRIISAPSHGVYAVAWDPVDRFVAYQDSARVHFWKPPAAAENETDGETIDTMIDERAIDIRPGAAGLAVAPDGSRVAVVNGDFVSIFAITGGLLEQTRRHVETAIGRACAVDAC
jgi:hypothetical protein